MAHLPPDVYLTHTFMHSGNVSPSTPKLQLHLSIPIPTRDSMYYYADGNTVLLVENTLFKVTSSRCAPIAPKIMPTDAGAPLSPDKGEVDVREHVLSGLGPALQHLQQLGRHSRTRGRERRQPNPPPRGYCGRIPVPFVGSLRAVRTFAAPDVSGFINGTLSYHCTQATRVGGCNDEQGRGSDKGDTG